jgi:hypothetical protein
MDNWRRWTHGKPILVLLVLALTLTSQASEIPETEDFGVIQTKATELGKRHGPENVLLVFDIDNTLLAAAAPAVRPAFRGVFAPYRLDSLASSGLGRSEKERFGLGKPRQVSYDRGVYMTAGPNKGAMLLVFLAHGERRFSVVVFVDDKKKHTESVR